MSIDRTAERLGRWTAQRTSRRGFLGRAGRVAVLVAGGPALAVLLEGRAEARVCGQSGVAPKCPNFDCHATWGWCWYASGCCGDGSLKKICDCCAPDTPHPRGYCPSGTRVLCIVESCGADPRLQTRPVRRLNTEDPVTAALHISRLRFPDGPVPVAVLGDAESLAAGASAAAAGRVAGGPVLLTPRASLPDDVVHEIARLGVEFVQVIGPALNPAIDNALRARGVTVERVGRDPDPRGLSLQVAAWVRSLMGSRSAVAVSEDVGPDGIAIGAAFAHLRRMPLVLASAARARSVLQQPRPVQTTFVLCADPASAQGYPGAVPVVGADPQSLSKAVADLALDRFGDRPEAIGLAPPGGPGALLGAAVLPGPLLLRTAPSLEGLFDWLLARRDRLGGAVTTATDVDDDTYYDLQSVLNEFEAHLLVGVGGQGLPVIPQPHHERPIGRARR